MIVVVESVSSVVVAAILIYARRTRRIGRNASEPAATSTELPAANCRIRIGKGVATAAADGQSCGAMTRRQRPAGTWMIAVVWKAAVCGPVLIGAVISTATVNFGAADAIRNGAAVAQRRRRWAASPFCCRVTAGGYHEATRAAANSPHAADSGDSF
jgi:hypothetical protein